MTDIKKTLPFPFNLLLQWTGRAGGGYWLAPQSRGRLQAGGGGCQDPSRQTDLPIIRCCGSGIVYPGLGILVFIHLGSLISDPGPRIQQQHLKKRGKIIVLFRQKFVLKLSKIWVWDPEKTYSGSRIQGKKAPYPESGTLQ